MKRCTRCHQEKPETEFNRSKNMKDGLDKTCKECRKVYRTQHKEHIAAKNKVYRMADPNDYRRRRRGYALKRNYGLSVARHHLMYLKQGGRCAICRESLAYDEVHTDHDHVTGKVRGLLCPSCNVFLGKIEKHRSELPVFLDYLDGKNTY